MLRAVLKLAGPVPCRPESLPPHKDPGEPMVSTRRLLCPLVIYAKRSKPYTETSNFVLAVAICDGLGEKLRFRLWCSV